MLQPRPLLRAASSLCSCRIPLRTLARRGYATIDTQSEPAGAGVDLLATDRIDRSIIALKTYKPRTPGLRHLKRPVNDHLWKGRALLKLTIPKKGQGKAGRNHTGRITVRHRGGGVKRRLRIVDFMRTAPGPHIVERIEYDPGRSGHIALLKNKDTGDQSYILAPDGLRAGDTVESFRSGLSKDILESSGGKPDPGMLAARTTFRGNCLPLHMIPVGTIVHNVGLAPEGKAVFCRSAGTYATIISKDFEGKKSKYVTVKLQSGEVRLINRHACATIGVVSNPHWQYRSLGKAGRARWLGIRPTVRGLAMNAFEHPHGGGRGKSKSNQDPVSPWGMPAKSGYKTRPRRNPNKMVVEARVRNQGKRRSS